MGLQALGTLSERQGGSYQQVSSFVAEEVGSTQPTRHLFRYLATAGKDISRQSCGAFRGGWSGALFRTSGSRPHCLGGCARWIGATEYSAGPTQIIHKIFVNTFDGQEITPSSKRTVFDDSLRQDASHSSNPVQIMQREIVQIYTVGISKHLRLLWGSTLFSTTNLLRSGF